MEIFFLVLCLLVVLAFEFVNGMNDTANAIAPVIYSHSLEPKKSVLIAAVLNFLGVLFGGIVVAMSIMHLLPLGTIIEQPVSFGIVLVISILVSAIIWDLGAWYLALPVSSSHALIGSILGVSIALMFTPAGADVIPHWAKAKEVIIGLLISPLIGFGVAIFLIYIAHVFIHKKQYFKAPNWSWDHPTIGMRTILIITSALVSFMHGKNDGQKGVGIATLILITILPASFAINPDIQISDLKEDITIVERVLGQIDRSTLSPEEQKNIEKTEEKIQNLHTILEKKELDGTDKKEFRGGILSIQETYKSISATKNISFVPIAQADEMSSAVSLEGIQTNIDHLTLATDYVPFWIILMVSIAIGSGTMIGWKRIVKTIGEKIGKHKMNYSQAAASALVTAGTIELASSFGLPVSTTHVMSSSVAGTMVEEHGWRNGVDPHMIKHILLAWLLTMPTTIILAGTIFYILQWIFVR